FSETTLTQYRDADFFVFPDLSVRTEGSFRLKLSLFEVFGIDVAPGRPTSRPSRHQDRMSLNCHPELDVQEQGTSSAIFAMIIDHCNTVRHCKSIFSAPFYVYTAKKFPGMEADQGIKIRIRKDIRVKKRPMAQIPDGSPANSNANTTNNNSDSSFRWKYPQAQAQAAQPQVKSGSRSTHHFTLLIPHQPKANLKTKAFSTESLEWDPRRGFTTHFMCRHSPRLWAPTA
ncbi:hypothetical protein MPER_06199, partial [Moniliophthora perniciosa FA553]